MLLGEMSVPARRLLVHEGLLWLRESLYPYLNTSDANLSAD